MSINFFLFYWMRQSHINLIIYNNLMRYFCCCNVRSLFFLTIKLRKFSKEVVNRWKNFKWTEGSRRMWAAAISTCFFIFTVFWGVSKFFWHWSILLYYYVQLFCSSCNPLNCFSSISIFIMSCYCRHFVPVFRGFFNENMMNSWFWR